MKETFSPPCPGQLVTIRKGRDAGQVAVVVELLDTRFVAIADGDRRKFDRRKRKNIQHLQVHDYISSEVRDSIAETGKVTNSKLRWALRKFLEDFKIVLEKGDEFYGEGRRN